MLSNKYPSLKFEPYVYEIIVDHQCGFQHNRSTVDQIFGIFSDTGEKVGVNRIFHQIFIAFKKAYGSDWWEVSYNILIKNAIFWDVMPCGSCENRCFRGT
jgi:hypothetical protein